MTIISDFNAATNVAENDLLPIVDISDLTMAATGTTKKVTAGLLVASAVTTRIVTAVDSIGSVESAYDCDGTDDHVQINAAIDSLSTAITDEALTAPTYVVINACDANTGFAGVGGASIAVEGTIKKYGSNSIAVTPGATSVNHGAELSGLSENLTTYTHLDFWIYSPTTPKFLITLTTADGNRKYLWKADKVGAWSHCRVPLNGHFDGAGTLTTVTAIAIAKLSGEATSGSYAPVTDLFYIDSLAATNEVGFANQRVHSGVVVTNNTGGTTYTENTDYELNYEKGSFYVLPGGAITSAQALLIDYRHGGGVVELASGTYNIGTTGILLRSFTVLKMDGGMLTGAGAGFSHGQSLIQNIDPTKRLRRVYICGGLLLGKRDQLLPTVNVNAIYIRNCEHVYINGVVAKHFSGHSIGILPNTIGVGSPENIYINDCHSEDCGGEYVDASGIEYGVNCSEDANYFDAAGSLYGKDFVLVETTHFLVSQCSFNRARGDAMVLKKCYDGQFSNNVVRDSRMGGMFLHEGARIYCTDNLVWRAGSRGLSPERVTDCLFDGNTFYQSGRENLWSNLGYDRCMFTNNKFLGAGYLRQYVDSTGADSNIRLSASNPNTCQDNFFANNYVESSSNYNTYAIRIDSDADIKRNTFRNLCLEGTAKGIFEGALATGTSWHMTNFSSIDVGPKYDEVWNSTTYSGGMYFCGAADDAVTGGAIFMRKARGSKQSLANIQALDRIGGYFFQGLQSTWKTPAALSAYVASVSTHLEGELRAEVAPASSTTRINRWRANASGFFIGLPTTAPADATLSNNECVFYNNAGVLTVKLKNNSGVVTTGTITTA